MINDIQFLRAVAILMVLGHHTKGLFPEMILTQFQQGLWAGVDLFFCISGYVVTKSLLSRLPEKRDFESNLKCCLGFWKARFWRIFPSMVTGIAFMLFAVLVTDTNSIIHTGLDALAALLQVANLHFYNCAIKESVSCGYGALYWSLSLEFQFYLLLPLLVLFLPKRWLVGGLLIALIVQIITPHTHWQNLLSFVRTESFIMGVLIAMFQNRKEAKLAEPIFLEERWIKYIFTPVLILALCVVGNQNVRLIPNPIALTALVSGILVFVAGYNKNYLCPGYDIMKKIFLWIGDRSYSIYLFHIYIFYWARYFMEHTGMPADDYWYKICLIAWSLVVGILVVELNYQFVEKKFKKININKRTSY